MQMEQKHDDVKCAQNLFVHAILERFPKFGVFWQLTTRFYMFGSEKDSNKRI